MMKARLLALPLLLSAMSCGQGEAGRVQLSLATDTEGEVLVLPPWAALLRVSISGPGIERPIVQELSLTEGVVQTVRIGNVPTGADRVLQISVLTESGWVAYYGTSAPFTVKAKSIAQITVSISPAPGADDPPDSPSFALLVNDGAKATANAEVTLELLATGISEMAVSNIALDPIADCATFPFMPYDAMPFSFSLLAGDGPKVVYALVRDAAGYCSRLITSDQVLLDTTGPAINAALLQGTPRPPGTEDTVLGLAGATEPGATIEIFAEEGLVSLVASATADDAGAFAPQNIGDNYTDEAGEGLVGQSTFHFVAKDALGNRGAKVTWQTDVTPPEIDVSSYAPAVARRGVTLSVWVHTDSQLAAPPEVRLTGYLEPTIGEAFDCDTFDAVSSAYLCTYATTGVEPEGAMTIVAIGTKPGAGNIARVEGGPVIFDYTPPDLTFSASDLVLTMNPSPAPDTLFVPPGTLEPNSTLIIYNAWGSSFGACGDHEVYAELLVDSAGGISHASLGDDIVEGMARARSVDEAGNDPCDPSCLPGDPICCPEGGIDIATCSSFVSLCNDASPPSTYPIAYPEQVISSRTATIYALASDSSCPGVTSVALTECQLDGGAFAPCMPSITYDDLALGPHIWSVRSVDTVGNTEYAYEHEFRVQRRTTLYDTYALGSLQNWSYEDLTQKAYLVDGTGVGHLFVGGEALWHFYDDGGGFAAEEIFRAPAMIPVAVSAGGNFHVLFASMDGSSLLLAEGETGAWEIEIVARPYNVLGGIDLAIDGTGATHVAYSTCSSTTCTGSSASVFILRREADGSWTRLDAAPNAMKAKSPRLLFDSEDNLWLATVRHESALHVLAMACRKEGVWDAAIELASPPAALATGLLDHFPTFTLAGGTSPLLTYTPSSDGDLAAVIYDGGVFGDASAPAYQGASALASSPGSEKWYASAHTATPGFVGLAQHGPAWSSQAIAAKGAPRVVSAAVLQEGTLATATVDVVYGDSGYGYDEPLYLGRTRLAAGVTTQRDIVIAGENIEIAADTDGVRTCVVWRNRLAQSLPLSDRLLGVCHLEGTAEGAAEVIFKNDGQGYAPDVAVLGAETWVVHESYSDSVSGRTRLRVEHHDGVGWHRLGPVTADGTSAVEPRIGRRAGVGPVIAYRYETNLTRLVWWNGAGFVSPTELPALISDSLQSLDIIADDTPDGRVWVVRGTTNGRLLITSVDLATEDTGTTTCETCVELFDITGAESPIVTAAAHDSGRVVLVSYKDNASDESVLHTWECSGAACLCASPPCARVVASLSAAMQPMRYDRALGWVAASDPAHLVNGSLVRNRLAAAFDSQGRLRLGIQYRDYDLTWGSYNYGLVIEGGDGVLRLYPAVPSGNDDALAIDLIVGPNDKARLFWPEYRTGRVFALAEDDL